MQTYTCTKCKKPLDRSSFYKNGDSISRQCKDCIRAPSRTRTGLVKAMMASQRRNSKRRKHPKPSYLLKELRVWVFSQENFEKLYLDWVESGHNTRLIPSCDRLDDTKPYSFDNIQLTTWGLNDEKQKTKSRSSLAVDQYTLDGILIQKFPSLASAQRCTGIDYKDLLKIFKCTRLTVGKFIWIFPVDVWPTQNFSKTKIAET